MQAVVPRSALLTVADLRGAGVRAERHGAFLLAALGPRAPTGLDPGTSGLCYASPSSPFANPEVA